MIMSRVTSTVPSPGAGGNVCVCILKETKATLNCKMP